MLLGTYYGVLSPKRRTAVPASFRKVLGKDIILAKWYEGGLVLGSAFSLEADEQGRVVIPEVLAAYAGLGKDVVFIGLGDRAEIWNKEEWLKKEIEISKNASRLLEEVANENKDNKGGVS